MPSMSKVNIIVNHVKYSHSFKEYFPVFLVVLVTFLYYFFTIRDGHSWDGDFSLYISHAKNIATGIAYTSTGYIYNPQYPGLGPQTYPPVFPLMLAPIYKLYGIDLHAMKILGIISFSVFLLFFYFYCTKTLGSRFLQLFVVLMVAISPWFWEQKNLVLSDIPFMLFVYITFYLFYSVDNQKNNKKIILLAIAIGFSCYLAYGTRSIGALLIVSFIAHDLIKARIITRPVIIATAVFSILFFNQNFVSNTHTDLSYIRGLDLKMSLDNTDNNKFSKSISDKTSNNTSTSSSEFSAINYIGRKIAKNVSLHFVQYATIMRGYWKNGFSRILQGIMGSIVLLFLLVGYFFLLRKKFKTGEIFIVELFAIIYIIALLIVPQYHGKRYLLPIIPLYLLYFVYGLDISLNKKSISIRNYTYALIITLVTVSYIGYLSIHNFTKFENGVEKKESVELFNFVRKHTPHDSVFIFRKPRVLALYTDRRSSAYYIPRNNKDELWAYINKINATYIIETTIAKDDQPKEDASKLTNPVEPVNLEDSKEYLDFIDRNRNMLETVFENADFRVYRIKT